MAQIDLGKVALTLGGNWANNVSYERLTFVLYESDGCGYISLKNNIGVTPGTDATAWQKASKAGLSIYELCVKNGTFVGTEAEFVAQYNAAVAAATAAATAASSAATSCAATEAATAAAETARAAAETARVSAETLRVGAETGRVSAEASRVSAETSRQTASAQAVAACAAAKTAADEATTSCNTATGNANTAAAAATAAAATVQTPFDVSAEHLAKLWEELEALKQHLDELGRAHAISLNLDELPQVCGIDFYSSGAGAPTASGVVKFAEYHDTTNNKFYKWNGTSWVVLN